MSSGATAVDDTTRAATDPDSPGPVLAVDDLHVTFRTKRRTVEAVRGITFSLEAGRTLVLLGESGSGKSVTARAILRLYGKSAHIQGSVQLADRSLLDLDERTMRSVRGGAIALVPQDPTGSLDPLRRISAQIVEVLRRHGLQRSRKEAGARARELLAQVGIPDPERVARSYPHELSGGMRQRAVIALAIACGPQILIADEPTTALDVTVQAQVLDLFGTLQDELGMAVLMITHDVGVARQVGDRVAVMYAGRLVEDGPAVELLDRPFHPYTTGLLGAVPTPEVKRGQLKAIPGRPPAAGEDVGKGCAFAPRCSLAEPACHESVPPLVPIQPGRSSACPVAVHTGGDQR